MEGHRGFFKPNHDGAVGTMTEQVVSRKDAKKKTRKGRNDFFSLTQRERRKNTEGHRGF